MTSEAATIGGPGIRLGNGRLEIEPHSCFACGSLNTHGLQLQLHAQDGRCWTALELPRRFEGWEGIAHGGIVATILDEVMAWALVEHDLWGVTARMALEFRRPVPVGVPIRAEGWLTGGRRRIVHAAGEITDGTNGAVLARGQATFVGATAERRSELQARYRARVVPDGPEDAA